MKQLPTGKPRRMLLAARKFKSFLCFCGCLRSQIHKLLASGNFTYYGHIVIRSLSKHTVEVPSALRSCASKSANIKWHNVGTEAQKSAALGREDISYVGKAFTKCCTWREICKLYYTLTKCHKNVAPAME